MSKQPKLDLKSIVAAATPTSAGADVVRLDTAAKPAPKGPATLKERARQLSVYLEPAVYDQLRDIAYSERSKMHTLMLEALDLLFKNRGALSIKEVEARSARGTAKAQDAG